MTIQWIGANSNNYEKGRLGKTVKKIVIHWIVGKLSAADATFQDPTRIASAHYGVGNTLVHQYVKEEDTAYHAGNLTVNRESIGIEHEGGPSLPISEETYKTSAQLIADICRRYAIPVDRANIIKHSEVKATQCPGTLDIDKLIAMVKEIVAPAPTANDQQSIIDQLRAERDTNWNLYQQEQKAKILLEDAVAQKQKSFDTLVKENLELKKNVDDTSQEKEDLSKALHDLQVQTIEDKKVHEKLVLDYDIMKAQRKDIGKFTSEELRVELKGRSNINFLLKLFL